jgi:hypothetical protein
MAGVARGKISPDRVLSGQRRTLVEEYYASLNWRRESDANKFLTVLGYALAQQYLSDEPRDRLQMLCKREGLIVDGIQVRFKNDKPRSDTRHSINPETLKELTRKLVMLDSRDERKRGFEFEVFLKDLFEAYGLEPRSSFRLVGEQIDGSFELNSHVYLLEAKWHSKQISQDALLIFREKVESKSQWSRGLLVSISGFTDDGIAAFARGRATNIIGMTGQDLYFILSGEISLVDAIARKARRAAESGEFYVPVFDLLRG